MGTGGATTGDGQTRRGTRPMRADALRNRRRIVAAATEVFAAHGEAVPIDVVADRAGVGVGTLYRHFPTKEALFEAIVADKVGDLVDAVELAQREPDPVGALFDFIELVVAEALMRHDLLDALGSAGFVVTFTDSPVMARLDEGLASLLQRAVAAGAVRSDLAASDVMGLVIGTCHGVRRMGGDADAAKRLVGVVCEGIRLSAR